jgi:hypothetical protein
LHGPYVGETNLVGEPGSALAQHIDDRPGRGLDLFDAQDLGCPVADLLDDPYVANLDRVNLLSARPESSKHRGHVRAW